MGNQMGVMAAVFLAGLSMSAHAADGLELAKSKNCLACHAVDKKIVGPGYKDIAAKYKSDKTAETHLIGKIQKGGTGVWGQIPMPAQPQVSPEEAKKLAKWVLSL
jgi:cytochrome c